MLTGMSLLCGITCYLYVAMRSVSVQLRFPRTSQSMAKCFWNQFGDKFFPAWPQGQKLQQTGVLCNSTSRMQLLSFVHLQQREMSQQSFSGTLKGCSEGVWGGVRQSGYWKAPVRCKGELEYRTQRIWRKYTEDRFEKHSTYCNCCTLLQELEN